MTTSIALINSKVNGIVWGLPSIILILGVGIILTFRLKGLQFRKLKFALSETIGKSFSKCSVKEGAVSPFQAMCTALAATVGTGSIAGVAGAIALGGPGAVFWMWVSAVFGMCTKYAEVCLSVKFREHNSKGDWVGGPMYFIKNGLGPNWKILGIVFSVFGILAVMGTGNATQVNTIVTSLDRVLISGRVLSTDSKGIFNLIFGIILAFTVAFILFGGIKSIGSVSEILVPFMSAFYVLMGFGVLVINYKAVPHAFMQIFEGAFNPDSITGGIVGSVFLSMRKGISRGIFSNEAGLGTASIAHAAADTDSPAHQGLFGIFEVFAASIIICTMTALIILCSGIDFEYGVAAGADLTINGFTATYGSWASVIVSIAVICFAFSTVLGWGLYGARCIEFLFGTKLVKPFMLLYSTVCVIGATMDLGLLWDIADTFNGLMAIPNIIAVAALIPVVVKVSDDYFHL